MTLKQVSGLKLLKYNSRNINAVYCNVSDSITVRSVGTAVSVFAKQRQTAYILLSLRLFYEAVFSKALIFAVCKFSGTLREACRLRLKCDGTR